jgi:hypothetical protein
MLLPVKKIFWIFVAAVIFLMAIYTFNTLSINFLPEELPTGFVEKFHIDLEANVPAWFSAAVLLSTSFLAFLILRLEQQLPASDSYRKTFWLIFMGLFAFLSLDESAMVHEFVGVFFKLKWVFIYAPFMAIVFAYLLYSLWVKKTIPLDTALWITLGLSLSVIAGLFLEWVGYQFQLPYAIRQIRYVLEESGEMLGAIFVLRGCLIEVNRVYQKVLSNRIASPATPPE